MSCSAGRTNARSVTGRRRHYVWGNSERSCLAFLNIQMQHGTIPVMTVAKHKDVSTMVSQIVQGDCKLLIKDVKDNSVHLILSDIPYGIGAEEWDVLHANTNSAYLGASPAQAKAGAVFKKRGKPLNGWSEADKRIPHEYYEWCRSWSDDWYRALKPGGSVFVFAGRRLAHRCVSALEDSGFIFKDSIAWLRHRAPHRAQRISVVFERRGDAQNAAVWSGWKVGNLRPTFEPILWFTKPYKIGTTIADNVLNHGVGAFNEAALLKYMHRPDNVISVKPSPEDGGLHPTQKPVDLMKALIELTTQPGQIVLDPFAGSGTTVIAAAATGRIGIGYEFDEGYALIAQNRLQHFVTGDQQKLEL